MDNKRSLTKKTLFSRSRSSSCIPVRQSRTSSVRNARSSSISRVGSIEPGSHISRQPSTSKLSSTSKRTPQNACRSSSVSKPSLNSYRKALSVLGSASRSKSPRRTVDARPVNDKIWQKDNHSLVRNYVACRDPELALLVKPDLTINSFINITQLLLEPLDSRIFLTTANYVAEVPYFLKMIGYPGVATASLMKTVNIKRSWGQVLAIWSWLVENLHALDSYKVEDILKKPEYVIAFKTICKLMGCAAENNPAIAEQKKQAAISEFESGLHEILGIGEIDKEALEEKRKHHIEQEAEVEKKRQILATLGAEIWNLEQQVKDKNEQAENRKKNLRSELERERVENAELEKQIEEKAESVKKLKERIASQKYTAREKKALDMRFEETKHRLQLKLEQREARLKEHDEFDLEIVQQKKQIRTLTCHINDVLTKLSRERSEIKQLIIPEVKFHSGSKLTETLGENKSKLKAIVTQINQESATLKQTFANEKLTRGKLLEETLKSAQEDLQKLDAESLRLEEQLMLKQSNRKRQVRKLHSELATITKEADEMKVEMELQKESCEQEEARCLEAVNRLKSLRGQINFIHKDWININQMANDEIKNLLDSIKDSGEDVLHES